MDEYVLESCSHLVKFDNGARLLSCMNSANLSVSYLLQTLQHRYDWLSYNVGVF